MPRPYKSAVSCRASCTIERNLVTHPQPVSREGVIRGNCVMPPNCTGCGRSQAETAASRRCTPAGGRWNPYKSTRPRDRNSRARRGPAGEVLLYAGRLRALAHGHTPDASPRARHRRRADLLRTPPVPRLVAQAVVQEAGSSLREFHLSGAVFLFPAVVALYFSRRSMKRPMASNACTR